MSFRNRAEENEGALQNKTAPQSTGDGRSLVSIRAGLRFP